MNIQSVSMTRQERYSGWFYFVFQLLILPDCIMLLCGLMGIRLSSAMLNLIFFGINFTCCIAIFHRFLWKTAKHTFRSPLRFFKAVGIGYALYWCLNFIIVYLTVSFFPQYQNANDAAISGMAQDYFAAMAVGTILLAPMTEELFFRGLIFRGLYGKNKILAYSVSSAAFCIIHLLSYIGSYSPVDFLVGFIQYLPAGVVFCYAYQKADSIYAPILIHMINNAIGIFAMR